MTCGQTRVTGAGYGSGCITNQDTSVTTKGRMFTPVVNMGTMVKHLCQWRKH